MMKQAILIGTVALLLSLLGASCTQPPVPATAPAASPAARTQESSASSGKVGWEAEWEKTVQAARKEGELMVYMHLDPGARIPMVDAFKKRFGITMDALSAQSPDLRSRLHAEYRAGVYQADVYLGGASGIILVTKPLGYLAPLEPALILPEVKDPKMWLNGKLPFFDQDGTAFAFLASSSPGIIYNTDLVKKGEIGSYVDLLRPEWKEKIIMSYPSSGGTAAGGMGDLVEEWGLDKTKEYLSYLVKEQKVVVTRNQYQTVEWVARGKVTIGLFSSNASVRQFVMEGAPIATPLTKEPKRMTSSNGGLAIFSRPAHPNATVLFVNWLLSREGQTLAAEAFGSPSARVDVPAEGLPEIARPQSGQKYLFQNEERSKKDDEYVNEWQRIIGQ